MDRGQIFSRYVAIELSAEGKRRGITQRQIAAAASIGEVQMSLYVAGKRGSLTVATLVHASERLGINPEVIVERAYAALVASDTAATVTDLPSRVEPVQRAARHSDAPKVDDADWTV